MYFQIKKYFFGSPNMIFFSALFRFGTKRNNDIIVNQAGWVLTSR